jgi:hypothetical protein
MMSKKIKVQASHGDVYEIPEFLSDVFWAMDALFAELGLHDEVVYALGAWDCLFDKYLIKDTP